MKRFLLCVIVLIPLLGGGTLFLTRGSAQEKQVKHWPRDYRHIHIKKARAATRGKFEPIVPMCTKMLKEYPQDGESLFFLGLAQAQLGNHKEAHKTIARSMSVGLPPGRFLVGPRNWVSKIRKAPEYSEFRKKHGSGLIHGPMLGDITPTSAKFWMRTAYSKTIEVRVTKGDKTYIGKGKTSETTDFVPKITVDGLTLNTTYQ